MRLITFDPRTAAWADLPTYRGLVTPYAGRAVSRSCVEGPGQEFVPMMLTHYLLTDDECIVVTEPRSCDLIIGKKQDKTEE